MSVYTGVPGVAGPLAAWEARMVAQAEAVVRRELDAEAARAAARLADLEALRPQLR